MRTLNVPIVLLATFLASHCPLCAATPLPNGDFENALDGWILSAAPNPDVFRVVSKPDAFAGQWAGLLELRADNAIQYKNYAYFGRRDLPATVGYYRFQFAMRTKLAKGSVAAHIAAQRPPGQNFMRVIPGQNGAPLISGTTGWTEYSIVYQIAIPADVVIVQLQMNDAEGQVWFDNVRVEKLDDGKGKMLMQQQGTGSSSAESYGAKCLGEPARNISAFKKTLYPDPKTGRPMLVINSCTSLASGAALFVDYENRNTDVVRIPIGSGGWDLIELSPGNLLFESLDPLFLVPIDVANRKVIVDDIVPVSENQYAWQFSRGPDGWIYFGSYPTCHAYRFDPRTRTVEDLGRMGPEGNTYVRFIGATGDGWLIASVMSEQSGVVAYNIADKSQFFTPLAAEPRLWTLDGVVYATIEGRLKQFDSASRAFKDVDLPAPEGAYWHAMHDSFTSRRKVLAASDGATYVIDAGGAAPRKIWDHPLRGGSIVGMDENDRVIGIRGQDYFVAEPLAKAITPIQITQDAPPVGIHFLRADPKGGVTGGPSLGQTLFRFDPARHLAQNTAQVVDGNGEVYDGHWVDGKFYFVSYSGGEIAVWDPDQPWDQWNNVNPKVLAKYNGSEFHGLIRPQGGLTIGPGGKLYSGWSATYGIANGGIGEYDIASNTARAWSSDILSPEISIGSVAGDDKYLYGVSSNEFNGLTRPAKPLIFFAFDPATEKIVAQHTLKDVSGAPKVVLVPETNTLWLATGHGIQRFDRDKMQLSEVIAWPKETGAPTSVDCRDARGRSAWFAVGNSIVQFDDGDSPMMKMLFTTTQGIQSLTASDTELYFTQRTQVWSAPLR